MTYFQKILIELMNEYGLNQTRLANILGIKQSQIHNWIHGKRKPNYDSIRALCWFFKTSADMLLDTNFVD